MHSFTYPFVMSICLIDLTLFLVVHFDMSNGRLEGEFPTEMSSLNLLKTLAIAQNVHSGRIPDIKNFPEISKRS